jgi:hypothetical protein
VLRLSVAPWCHLLTSRQRPGVHLDAAPSSHLRHRPHAPWIISIRVVLMLCSQHRAKDRSGTPAAFDALHCRAPHHGRAASGTESPGRHLLQHSTGILLLTDISSGASDLPSGLPPLSTPAACTPPWTTNPGDPPSFPTPKLVCHAALVLLAPSSPVLAAGIAWTAGPPPARRGRAPWLGELPCSTGRRLPTQGPASQLLGLAKFGPKCTMHFLFSPMNYLTQIQISSNISKFG